MYSSETVWSVTDSDSLLGFIGISPSDDRCFPFLCCLCGYIFVSEKNIKSDDYEK